MAANSIEIVFLIGSGRCGSSLIHELVARHRDVGFISNFDDNLAFLRGLGRFNNAILRSPIGRFTKKGRLRFAPSEAYSIISRQVSPIYANSCRNLQPTDVTPSLKRKFRDFFLDRYRAQSKPVFLHKYTGWSRASFFKEIFPDARFVHIVRDGRAVANSFLQMDWWTGYESPEKWYLGPLSDEDEKAWRESGKSFVTLAGLAWRILVDSVEEDVAQMDDSSTMTVRYEDFLQSPGEKIRDICEFSGLEFNPDMERQMGKSPVRSGRQEAYLQDLTQDQVTELTQLLAPVLQRYGYAA